MKIVLLTVNAYKLQDGKEGVSCTYLNNKYQFAKQSLPIEHLAELQKNPLPAIYDVVDFEMEVKKNKDNTTTNTFKITALKYLKEVKLF